MTNLPISSHIACEIPKDRSKSCSRRLKSNTDRVAETLVSRMLAHFKWNHRNHLAIALYDWAKWSVVLWKSLFTQIPKE